MAMNRSNASSSDYTNLIAAATQDLWRFWGRELETCKFCYCGRRATQHSGSNVTTDEYKVPFSFALKKLNTARIQGHIRGSLPLSYFLITKMSFLVNTLDLRDA